MKKYILSAFVAMTFGFVSCDVETSTDPGGTAVEKMAGHWVVDVDAVDANDKVVDGLEGALGHHVGLFTYNTSANVATEMFIDDVIGGEANIWEFKVKVAVDYNAMTFTSNGDKDNLRYDCKVNIDKGKITPNGGTTTAGKTVDAIEFFISFSDDTNPGQYGFTRYKVHGYRYTGFPEDN